MERNQKIGPWRTAGRLFSLLCLCCALALVLFPVAGPAEPVSAAAGAVAEGERPAAAARPAIGRKLIPLGRTTGIKLYSEGTMVVGFSDVCGADSPAEEGGLRVGDVIVSLNGAPVTSNESLIGGLAGLEAEGAAFTVLRDGARRELTVRALRDAGDGWRIGAWIRDSIAGIGTITFVDPETGAFGALGHGVCDADTGQLMPFGSGAVMASEVAAVQKGESGSPGQLSGRFELTRDQGVLSGNTDRGLFGVLRDERLYAGQEAVETAPRSALREGRAVILSNVSGAETRRYDVEITKVCPGADDGRELMLRVIDPALLAVTGGIVQGMSGSPILQDGKLVGAVTHVLVNDPTRGYGISLETMMAAP